MTTPVKYSTVLATNSPPPTIATPAAPKMLKFQPTSRARKAAAARKPTTPALTAEVPPIQQAPATEAPTVPYRSRQTGPKSKKRGNPFDEGFEAGEKEEERKGKVESEKEQEGLTAEVPNKEAELIVQDRKTINPKPKAQVAGEAFKPQTEKVWASLNREIGQAIERVHSNPAAGIATPEMIVTSIGPHIIGPAILHNGINQGDIAAAIKVSLANFVKRKEEGERTRAERLKMLELGEVLAEQRPHPPNPPHGVASEDTSSILNLGKTWGVSTAPPVKPPYGDNGLFKFSHTGNFWSLPTSKPAAHTPYTNYVPEGFGAGPAPNPKLDYPVFMDVDTRTKMQNEPEHTTEGGPRETEGAKGFESIFGFKLNTPRYSAGIGGEKGGETEKDVEMGFGESSECGGSDVLDLDVVDEVTEDQRGNLVVVFPYTLEFANQRPSPITTQTSSIVNTLSIAATLAQSGASTPKDMQIFGEGMKLDVWRSIALSGEADADSFGAKSTSTEKAVFAEVIPGAVHTPAKPIEQVLPLGPSASKNIRLPRKILIPRLSRATKPVHDEDLRKEIAENSRRLAQQNFDGMMLPRETQSKDAGPSNKGTQNIEYSGTHTTITSKTSPTTTTMGSKEFIIEDEVVDTMRVEEVLGNGSGHNTNLVRIMPPPSAKAPAEQQLEHDTKNSTKESAAPDLIASVPVINVPGVLVYDQTTNQMSCTTPAIVNNEKETKVTKMLPEEAVADEFEDVKITEDNVEVLDEEVNSMIGSEKVEEDRGEKEEDDDSDESLSDIESDEGDEALGWGSREEKEKESSDGQEENANPDESVGDAEPDESGLDSSVGKEDEDREGQEVDDNSDESLSDVESDEGDEALGWGKSEGGEKKKVEEDAKEGKEKEGDEDKEEEGEEKDDSDKNDEGDDGGDDDDGEEGDDGEEEEDEDEDEDGEGEDVPQTATATQMAERKFATPRRRVLTTTQQTPTYTVSQSTIVPQKPFPGGGNAEVKAPAEQSTHITEDTEPSEDSDATTPNTAEPKHPFTVAEEAEEKHQEEDEKIAAEICRRLALVWHTAELKRESWAKAFPNPAQGDKKGGIATATSVALPGTTPGPQKLGDKVSSDTTKKKSVGGGVLAVDTPKTSKVSYTTIFLLFLFCIAALLSVSEIFDAYTANAKAGFPMLLQFLIGTWISSRWSVRKTLGQNVCILAGDLSAALLRVASLVAVVGMVVYTTTIAWLRALALSHGATRAGGDVTGVKVVKLIEEEFGASLVEGWSGSGSNGSRMGPSFIEVFGEGSAGIWKGGLEAVFVPEVEPSVLMSAEMCPRYELGVGGGAGVKLNGGGAGIGSWGLALLSMVVWGAGNKKQLRKGNGR